MRGVGGEVSGAVVGRGVVVVLSVEKGMVVF